MIALSHTPTHTDDSKSLDYTESSFIGMENVINLIELLLQNKSITL